MATIGVLALQGGFAPHVAAIAAIGHRAIEVRTERELASCDGLVLPGGESTVFLRLLDRDGLREPVADFVRSGRPVLGTCAGVILLARRVRNPEQPSFGALDVEVERNAYGRQLDSFEATSDDGRHPLMLIRAPRIVGVGKNAEVLATHGGEPILVRTSAVLGATFHPELTGDRSVHAAAFGSLGPRLK
jgi:5'-phosphate synthase pdxT subunit